jgi:hypothetical protein
MTRTVKYKPFCLNLGMSYSHMGKTGHQQYANGRHSSCFGPWPPANDYNARTEDVNHIIVTVPELFYVFIPALQLNIRHVYGTK